MPNKQSEIDTIIAALEQQANTPNALAPLANAIVQYYDALVEAGLEKDVALTLTLQCHAMMWALAFQARKADG